MQKYIVLAAMLIITASIAKAQAPTYSAGAGPFQGNNGAGTTAVPAELVASAAINSVFSFDVVNGIFDCGHVAVGSRNCELSQHADLLVHSNAAWTLSVVDFTENTPDTVLLYNEDMGILQFGMRTGIFSLDLVTSPSSGGNTGPAGTAVTIGPKTINAIPASGLYAIVAGQDDFGRYFGNFIVTMLAAY